MTFSKDKQSIFLWHSLQGDFCVLIPYPCLTSSFHDTLHTLLPLVPPNNKKIAFCPALLNNTSLSESLSCLLKAGFEKVYLYPQESAKQQIQLLNENDEAKSICIPCQSIQEILQKRDLSAQETLFFCFDRNMTYTFLSALMEGSPPPNHLTIDLSAIQENVAILRQRLPENAQLLAMIKANGYGTHELLMARFLKQQGVNFVGVAHAEEALLLRRSGIHQHIFIINASEHEMAKAALAKAEVGLYTKRQIIAASKAAEERGERMAVHLHIDTGMKRFGAHPSQALSLASLIGSLPTLFLAGLFTHFPAADNPNHDSFSHQQIERFSSAVSILNQHGFHPPHIHIANSAALFRFPLASCTMVRAGISLYGYSPSSMLVFPELRPALTLHSTIAGLVRAEKGDTVSYGRHFVVPHTKATLAVIPLGYFDGIHRIHHGKQTVRIRGKEAPLIGSICMDYMMADLTSHSSAKTGDHVLIFGKDGEGTCISPLSFAEGGGTILHEFLTCLGPRIRRLFLLPVNSR